MGKRVQYVCFNCYVAVSHPLKNCMTCPAPLVRKEFDFPMERGYFESTDKYPGKGSLEKYCNWLKSLGFTWGGK